MHLQGHETPTDEALPYGNPEEGDLGSQSMLDTSRPSDFASEPASQSSIQQEGLSASGNSGGLHSQKSGQRSGLDTSFVIPAMFTPCDPCNPLWPPVLTQCAPGVTPCASVITPL